ncbi:cytochrome P450 [Massarina eburnea CBS 473.64]|uniref:Cytochrome P450 n=1 Tax=Massarina eburnea CBS 473.64 TaxID=1395130 RepID=A0A6A6S613_9PLEO|nr:cytochrome P450 [Massarina eburnea CBS 473.64]
MGSDESLVQQYLTPSNIFGAFLTYIVISLVADFFFSPKYPTSIPWVGHGKSLFGTLRNTFAGFTQSKSWMQDGYDLYSKHGKAFVFPSMLGATAQTMIPRSQMSWMLDQPDHVLSTSAAHYEVLHGDYSFVSKTCLKDPYHEHVVHKNLARNLNAVIPDLDDEVSRDVDELLGTDTETWKKIDPLEGMMMRIIPKITNRVLVGEPLCRNKDYLDNMLGFTMDVIRGFLLFTITPQILHPIVGPIHGLAAKYHYWRTSQYSLPLIKQRLSDIGKKDAGDPEFKNWKEPNDYVTWSIRTSIAEGRRDELNPSMIALRILPLNFASIHTTALTGSATLLDIFSSSPDVVQSLREEALRVYTAHGRKWTKTGLSSMYRIDSAIRESQRISAFSLSFIQRKVMVKEGIVSPEGVHLAYGTIVAAPWIPLAGDEQFYETPEVYDAFRYSRERERYEGLSAEDKAKEDVLKFRQTGLVTTNDRHLPFGHGRHACPGRFFVAHELKMMIGHLLIHYDIKPLKERPQPMWVGRNQVPAKADLEIRRLKVE